MPTAVTFDVDWAPDWAIDICASLCRQHSVPATFFITHDSPILRDLESDPLFELGIHPNFLSGSTHGAEIRDVLAHCIDIVPNAVSMRCHALCQSSQMYAIVADEFPQIEIDVSIYLPTFDRVKSTELHLGETCRPITRLPYVWEDDLAATAPYWSWSDSPPEVDEFSILDFHPVHIALNMNNLERYAMLKRSLGSTHLSDASRDVFAPFVNYGAGTAVFLESMLKADADFVRICDLK